MKYKIEINYNTGNSFKTERGVKDLLELDWNDLDVAKENLKRIREHYEMYKEIYNSYASRKEDDEIRANMSKQRWGTKDDYCLKLVTDDGTEMQLCAFWVGYFETLNGAKIIFDTPEDNDLEFEV